MLNKNDKLQLLRAKVEAANSPDPSTKVGALVMQEGVPGNPLTLGIGHNRFPRGIEASPARLHDREIKYAFVIHAEVMALMNRYLPHGKGTTLYVWPLPPCSRCAAQIIEAGVRRVVCPDPRAAVVRWSEDCILAEGMFREAGVELEFYQLEELEDE